MYARIRSTWSRYRTFTTVALTAAMLVFWLVAVFVGAIQRGTY